LLLAQKKDMRQIVMITDGKPSALTMPDGRIYKTRWAWMPTCSRRRWRVTECRRAEYCSKQLHARPRPGLVEFVKMVSSITRGTAYFTNTMSLASSSSWTF